MRRIGFFIFISFILTPELVAQTWINETEPACFQRFYRIQNHGNNGYIRHAGAVGYSDAVDLYNYDWIWQIIPGLSDNTKISFRATNFYNRLLCRVGQNQNQLVTRTFDDMANSKTNATFTRAAALDNSTNGYSYLLNAGNGRYISKKNNNTEFWTYKSSENNTNFNKNSSFTEHLVQTAAIAYGNTDYHTDYGMNGFSIPLLLGNYNSLNVSGNNGIDDIQSLRVAPGYKITTYTNNNYTGNATVYTSNQANLSAQTIQSLKVELNVVSGLSGDYRIKNVGTGKYMHAQNSNIQLQDYTGGNRQQFTITETSTPGLYTINRKTSANRYLVITNGTSTDGTPLNFVNNNTIDNTKRFYIVKTREGSADGNTRYLIVPECTVSGDSCKFIAHTTQDDVARLMPVPYDDTRAYWELDPMGVSCFQHSDYGGYCGTLPQGNHNTAALSSYGISDNDISSFKIGTGYQVICFYNDNYEGTAVAYNTSTTFVGGMHNDQFSSMIVTPASVTGMSGYYTVKNVNSSLFLDLEGQNYVTNGNAVQMPELSCGDTHQYWLLEELAAYPSVYVIKSVGVGGNNVLTRDGNNFKVAAYSANNTNQRFLLHPIGDYYQIMCYNGYTVAEVTGSSTASGANVASNNTNTGADNQQWQLQRHDRPDAPYGAAYFYQNANFGGKVKALAQGNYTYAQLLEFDFCDNWISSLKVSQGYKVTIYTGDKFTGTSTEFTSDQTSLNATFDNAIQSLKIEILPIQEDLTDNGGTITSSHAGANENEGVGNLIANDYTHKFCVTSRSSDTEDVWITYHSPVPVRINGYGLWSANDNPGYRDPQNFKIEGSNDGTDWVKIDTVSNHAFSEIYQYHHFDTPGQTACYEYIRLYIGDVTPGSYYCFQLGELQLFGDEYHDYTFSKAAGDKRVRIVCTDTADRLVVYLPDGTVMTERAVSATEHSFVLDLSDDDACPNGTYRYRLYQGGSLLLSPSANVVY
ncbi:MAG: RICIN domain-containing protein [Paludibacteraceae bacterium]|nr:RICIN domain-containing protein [Paludibacteraceae bacterium]